MKNILGIINDVLPLMSLVALIKNYTDKSLSIKLNETLNPMVFMIRHLFGEHYWRLLSEGIRYDLMEDWGTCYVKGSGMTHYNISNFMNKVMGPDDITELAKRARYNASIFYYLGELYSEVKYSLRYVKLVEIIGIIEAGNKFIQKPDGIIGMTVPTGTQASDVVAAMWSKEKKPADQSLIDIAVAMNSKEASVENMNIRSNKTDDFNKYIENQLNYVMSMEPFIAVAFHNHAMDSSISLTEAGSEWSTSAAHFRHLTRIFAHIGTMKASVKACLYARIITHPVFNWMNVHAVQKPIYERGMQLIEKIRKLDFLKILDHEWDREGTFKENPTTLRTIPQWLYKILTKSGSPKDLAAKFDCKMDVETYKTDLEYEWRYGDPTNQQRRLFEHNQMDIKSATIAIFNTCCTEIENITDSSLFEYLTSFTTDDVKFDAVLSKFNFNVFMSESEVPLTLDEITVADVSLSGGAVERDLIDLLTSVRITSIGFNDKKETVDLYDYCLKHSATACTILKDAADKAPGMLKNGKRYTPAIFSTRRNALAQSLWDRGWDLVPDSYNTAKPTFTLDEEGIAKAMGFKSLIKLRRALMQRLGNVATISAENLSDDRYITIELIAMALLNVGLLFKVNAPNKADFGSALQAIPAVVPEKGPISAINSWGATIFNKLGDHYRGPFGAKLTEQQFDVLLSSSKIIKFLDGLYFIPYTGWYTPPVTMDKYEKVHDVLKYEQKLLTSIDAREFIKLNNRRVVWTPDPEQQPAILPMRGVAQTADDMNPELNNVFASNYDHYAHTVPFLFSFKFLEDDDIPVPQDIFINDSRFNITHLSGDVVDYSHNTTIPRNFAKYVGGIIGDTEFSVI